MQAAKKAEKKGEWKKALEAWKAAYSSDVNAEYLIGIGDAYSHLGNKSEAKKNYEAYLADPLALPANVEKVKTRIAELDNPAGGLALPGGPGLALPGGDAPPPLPGASEPPPLPGLDLPGAAPAPSAKAAKKGKKGAEPMALPGLDLPAPPPTATAEKKQPDTLALPGLDLPAPPPSSKGKETKVASASPPPPGLELPGLPMPPPTTATPAKPDKTATPPPGVKAAKKQPDQALAMATPPPPKQEPKKVPNEALIETPAPKQAQAEASGTSKTVAYITAGVALVALGGGAYAMSAANSAHSDLIGSVHTGAEAQSLLEQEQKNKTLSFVGFATGLVAAGIATALFVF